MKKEVNVTKVKAGYVKLNDYCVFSNADSDYLSVTEWVNGEGYDIDINGRKEFRLTLGEFEAIRKLIKEINKS